MTRSHEHSGHRNRMRIRYIDQGIESLQSHEVLELLLYYAIPRQDTNSLAHKLLKEFGSISAVLDAPYSRLLSEGLTENTATYLRFIADFVSIYEDDKFNSENSTKYLTMKDIRQRFINRYLAKENEVLYLLLMDSKKKEIFFDIVSSGCKSNVDISIPQICELAVRYSARYAVISHNHPSGFSYPSNADIEITIKVFQALSLLGVQLLDHFIIAEKDSLSLKEARLFFHSQKDYEKSEAYKTFHR